MRADREEKQALKVLLPIPLQSFFYSSESSRFKVESPPTQARAMHLHTPGVVGADLRVRPNFAINAGRHVGRPLHQSRSNPSHPHPCAAPAYARFCRGGPRDLCTPGAKRMGACPPKFRHKCGSTRRSTPTSIKVESQPSTPVRCTCIRQVL